MSAEKEGSPQTEKSIWEIYNQELCLWIQFMKAIYGVNLQPVPASGNMYISATEEIPATTILDTHGNFLETQITSVMALSKDGKELSPTSNDQNGDVSFAETPAKAIAYLGYIKMEYQSQGPEKFQATGFKSDYNKPEELDQAMRERACAALSLAYAAKAKGWEKVNFDNTEDPVDRMMLLHACEYVGLSCGEEKALMSSVMNKRIKPSEAMLNGALVTKVKDDNVEQTADEKIKSIYEKTLLLMNNFIYTKTNPLDPDQGLTGPSETPVKESTPIQTQQSKHRPSDFEAQAVFA